MAKAVEHMEVKGATKHMGRMVPRLANRMLRLRSDDAAQAMTEFVIVIPIVLLTFFAAMQTMLIGEAAQFCNYAAFAAARSYATSYAKFERDNEPDPREKAISRARCVAAMALAPVSSGMNYLSYSAKGELTGAMKGVRIKPGNSQGALKQQLLEGFAVAFVYRIEGFQITVSNDNPTIPDPIRNSRSTVDCQFTYRLPLALPGLAEMWDYKNTTNRLENVAIFGENNAFTDDATFAGPRDFDPVGMYDEFMAVLENWHAPSANRASIINAYRNYFISGGNGRVPANVRIGAKARVGFEPLIGDMP